MNSRRPQQAFGLIFWVAGIFLFGMGGHCFAQNKPVQVAPDEPQFAQSLAEREALVISKEKSLSERESKLNELEKNLAEKLADIMARQDELANKLSEFQGLKDTEFRSMVKIYSTMSASKTAPLLNQMEDATVARILRAMKSDIVAKILPKLNQEKAVRVSKILGLIE